jgi:hypothetical protein
MGQHETEVRMEDSSKTKKADRRQSPRCTPNADVFIAFRPQLGRLGMLKDLSETGAAFEYAVFANYETVVDVEVDMFASNPSNFLLRRVLCRVVYDIKIAKPTLIGLETRRCGLKFEKLSDQQKDLMKDLLSNSKSEPLTSEYVNKPY